MLLVNRVLLRLLAVGAACIAAAWFYTGGPRPYGYNGLGEVFVFLCFGVVAVAGTVLAVLVLAAIPARIEQRRPIAPMLAEA